MSKDKKQNKGTSVPVVKDMSRDMTLPQHRGKPCGGEMLPGMAKSPKNGGRRPGETEESWAKRLHVNMDHLRVQASERAQRNASEFAQAEERRRVLRIRREERRAQKQAVLDKIEAVRRQRLVEAVAKKQASDVVSTGPDA